MNNAFFNIGSLILGLLSWAIPVLGADRRWRSGLPHVASLGLCGLSLCFLIFEAGYRIKVNDFSALTDTWRAVSIQAVVLLAVTMGLNVLLALANREEGTRKTGGGEKPVNNKQ